MIETDSEKSKQVKQYKFPMSPEEALTHFRDNLTSFERNEIKAFTEIFYVNFHELADEEFLNEGEDNHGYDDE